MGVVRLLPGDVASRIAAGEVIERPSSVLKELIENSLDAGAKKLTVEIRGAGKRMIRISDDGNGLSPEDCRAAFLRHSTSKIKDFNDIEKLSTYGFRGEALFSIAAVSRVTLTSRLKGSRKAWRVEMDGGKLVAEREAPPAAGTTVEVRDLFFNTPARAKFLKSDGSERSQLTRAMEEAALAHPETAFTFKSEGRTLLSLAGHKSSSDEKALRERVGEVLGEEYGDNLLHADREKGDLTLRAFFSPADALRSSRNLQFFFVNKRPITSRVVQQALYRAYEPFRPKNRHPAVVVYLRVPGEKIDVNVHPTKREVRFRPESSVFETVASTLSKALLDSKGIPTLDSAASDRGILDELTAGARVAEPARFQFDAQDRGAPAPARTKAGTTRTSPALAVEPRPWFPESLRYLGQVERSYLIFESEGGLLVVDQHAAQERVLFERYLKDITSGKPSIQKLMLPLKIDLPASGVQKALSQAKRLKRIGFEIKAFGKTALNVTAIPAHFQDAKDVEQMVHGVLDTLLSPRAAAAELKHDAIATVACKAAVKAHDALGQREALRLMDDLKACDDPSCCPHGRPTMLRMSRDDLARRFERSGAPPL